MAEKAPSFSAEVAKYVSNTDRDVYTVTNLPEEVVAVIFAYVSRSPKGFRENIETVIREEQHGSERASKFHEKWVLNYGHASVAEHAAVHVGVEKSSRLFSSVLELSDEFLSFTEYSQRYQRPEKGDFHVPVELDAHPALRGEFIELNLGLYDTYATLNDLLFDYLVAEIPAPEGTAEKAHHRALQKVAFEDARYALTLAMHTNLGMTGNARAMESSLSKLLSSRYSEVRARAAEIKEEVRFSVPTLVKYAEESPYIKGTRGELTAALPGTSAGAGGPITGGAVTLTDFTGKGSTDPEGVALHKLLAHVIAGHSEMSYRETAELIATSDPSALMTLFTRSIEGLGKFDNPLGALKAVTYEAEFLVSEACWHQLLRHRKVNWTPQEPTVHIGVEIPPNIEACGAAGHLLEATHKSEGLFTRLCEEGLRDVASYTVTNAHLRRALGSFDLWELYHLTNLRMSEGAQWDIKNTTAMLANQIAVHHPNLVGPALKRSGNSA